MYRIGEGYDVHKLVEGRDLIIGGVKIPYDKGLLGHSDADVLLHAIMDSILGALALYDIGKHFPDTDNKYKDISSIELLKHVKAIVNDYENDINKNDKSKLHKVTIENIDATIICQAPKMRPYIDEMIENVASALLIKTSQVNIKATTEEGLGFTGEGLGIAARSICLVSID